MVNTPYKKDTDLSPPFTANRRRRHLGRGSPERGAVARRRLRGRPAGPLPPLGIKIRRRHLKQNTSTQCKSSKSPSQKDRQTANEQAFRLVVPKCARLQRLRRAAGCFGEKAATPNPGRGLRFPVRRLHNRNSPHPHQKAAVKNRGLTAEDGRPRQGIVPPKGCASSPTANRRRRLLGRASPERGGVARRRRRGRPPQRPFPCRAAPLFPHRAPIRQGSFPLPQAPPPLQPPWGISPAAAGAQGSALDTQAFEKA